jgi:hypothetical protein
MGERDYAAGSSLYRDHADPSWVRMTLTRRSMGTLRSDAPPRRVCQRPKRNPHYGTLLKT